MEGRSQTFVRVGDGGSRITFHFCPMCGSTVHYAIEDMDDMVAVPVGAFADPEFPAPVVSIYEDRRHAWVRVPDNVEHIS